MILALPRLVALAFCFSAVLAGTGTLRAQEGLAGAYLAARQAGILHDYRAEAEYYGMALVRDPSNPELLQNALIAFVRLGEVEKAVPIARRLSGMGTPGEVANLVLISDQMRRGAFDEAVADLDAGRQVAPLVDALIRAWARYGEGRMSEALDAFDAAADTTGLRAFVLGQKALALAAAGDFEGADQILSGDAAGPLQATRRGVLAHARVLSQLERNDDAVALLDAAFGREADPWVADLRARLVAGEILPFDTVTDAREGAAELFYAVAGALNGDAMDGYTLIYARLAQYLAPGMVDATLMAAQLLEGEERYQLAIETYESVPDDDPAFFAAQLGRAEAMRRAGDTDAAIAALRDLIEVYPTVAMAHVTLGDTLRGEERYDEARQAYDRAIALLGTPESEHWIVYFARGIAHERLGMWEKAEPDFRQALELEPDQPQVLNYLGYSFVEMKTNLDEALGMIERAVAARPRDGYITDSLGWVLFRLGRHEEAVPHMERAAALMPVDPIVNDHLGDVYWAVGRRNEARFQWRRALSFDPEEDEAERIRRKLEVGLDRVLDEEGAPPLDAVNDG